MVSLLNVDRVQYTCECEESMSLSRMYYCRHCCQLRCMSCAMTEIDCMFCPNCLENLPLSEARAKRNRCFNCSQCPICAMTLTARTCVDSGGTYLVCATCRWSTRNSGTPDQSAASNWPVLENPLDKELNGVLDHMKSLELAEKAQRDQNKFSKRRSNVGFAGTMFSDRFGLQAIYQKRKQAMEQPKSVAEPHLASDENPTLDDSIFSVCDDLSSPSIESIMMQPIAGDRPLGPIHMPLKARKATRCRGCDHNLSKLDYSPSSIKFKIQYFARNVLPEIRLSRETELIRGKTCPVFLTLYNHTEVNSEVMLIGDPQDGCVECITPVIECIVPGIDETADAYSTDSERTTVTSTGNDHIVFRKRNRVGIRLDVNAPDNMDENSLSLVLKYKNSLTVHNKEQQNDWKIVKVRVTLGKS